MTKRVVRGEGGRFKSVEEKESGEQCGYGEQTAKRLGETGAEGIPGPAGPTLVTCVQDNADALYRQALGLSKQLYTTGLVANNYLHDNLSSEAQSDVGMSSVDESEEYSAGHLIGLIKDIDGYTNCDPRLSAAGNVLGFRVIPSLSLALFVLFTVTDSPRDPAFSSLLDCRAFTNNERYSAIIDMHNAIAADAEEVEKLLFGQPMLIENYKSRLTENDLSLLDMLTISNEVLKNACNIFEALNKRLEENLS